MEANRKISLTIPCCLDCVPIAGRALKGILSGITKDTELVFLIELGVCEAISNSIKHAHSCNAGCNVDISVFLYTSDIVVEVTDTGTSLDADLLDDTQYRFQGDDTPAAMTEGGRGLYLIHKTMDEVKYKSLDGKNILTMKKKLPPTDGTRER